MDPTFATILAAFFIFLFAWLIWAIIGALHGIEHLAKAAAGHFEKHKDEEGN